MSQDFREILAIFGIPGIWKTPENFCGNFFELDYFDIFSDFQHFRFNFWKLFFQPILSVTEVRKWWLRNRKFLQHFPYCENRTTGAEKRSRNYDFQTSVTGICSEIETVVIPYLRLNTAANKLDSNEQLIFLSLQHQKTLTCKCNQFTISRL